MTGRIVVALSLLFVMNLMMACFSFDCPPASSYYLTGIYSYPIDVNINTSQNDTYTETIRTDTLRNQLAFETNTHVEFAALKRRNDFNGFINTAYGCIDNVLLNPIDISVSSFSTNKAISIRDARGISGSLDDISPYTNLLQEELIKSQIDFPTALTLEESITRININDNILFPEGDYEFYFKWQTSNGIQLMDTVQVYLDF